MQIHCATLHAEIPASTCAARRQQGIYPCDRCTVALGDAAPRRSRRQRVAPQMVDGQAPTTGASPKQPRSARGKSPFSTHYRAPARQRDVAQMEAIVSLPETAPAPPAQPNHQPLLAALRSQAAHGHAASRQLLALIGG